MCFWAVEGFSATAFSVRLLFIQYGTKDGNHEVREMRRSFIELKPAHDTMIGEILPNARFRNSEMLGETGFDGLRAPAEGPASQKIRNSDPEGLASLDVIVTVQVGIGENKNTWSGRSVLCVT